MRSTTRVTATREQVGKARTASGSRARFAIRMASHIDGLLLRRVMGPAEWLPPDPFGPDGWRMLHRDGDGAVIATCAEESATVDTLWAHASISRRDRIPTYDDLKLLHRAVFFRGPGWAYQVFAPASEHVNIHPYTLHLWGRLDGTPVLPEFGMDVPLLGRSI